MIEGQGAWEGRGNGFGQVAAGVSARHPAGQPGQQHCSSGSQLRRSTYGIVDCHFAPRIVTDSRAEVAPLWASEAVGETINCRRNKLGKMIYNGPGAQDSTVCSRNRKCKRCVVTEIPGTKSRPVSSVPIDPLLVPGAFQRSH